MKNSSNGKAGRINRGVLDSRRERLAAALRDNLRKRKAQARTRDREAVGEAASDGFSMSNADKAPS